MIHYLSVCSGIEAASAAWHPLGWTPVAFAEIEKFPSAVLAHHYQTVPNFGDITKFQEWPDANVDVLVGGTPCQSFSVAGLRAGLADPRGNLMLTYLAIAGRYRPEWLVWENVPGVLSSNGGRDFAALLRGMEELGYGVAYRILDAQYFGVPQRRRRVFVVGCLGGWQRAAAVLFERHSLSGHPAPRREAREGIAGAVTQRIDRGGVNSEGGDGHLIAHALRGKANLSHRKDADTLIPSVANPLTARMHKGINTTCDEGQTMIAHALRGEGFDASEDGTVRGTPLVPVVASTHKASHDRHRADVEQTLIPVAFAQNQRDEVRTMDVAGALASEPGMKQQTYVAFGAQNSARQGASASASVTPTLDKSKVPGVGIGMQVRRLTPRECERLQGFPDDYTLIPYRNRPAADSPRYKALGNSMAVPVMRWIGERIAKVAAIVAADGLD